MPDELPKGFKMTELGPLPEDWGMSHLGELFDIQQGKSLSPKSRAGKCPRPFLRTANVLWGRLDLSSVDEMDFSEQEVARLRLMPGDLLVCEGGEVARTAIWEGGIDPCCYQNHIHRLRVRGAIPHVESRFFMYWMQAAILVLGMYRAEGNVTTIPNLSKSRLSRFAVPVPPLSEQRNIAGVLSAVQEAKEKTEAVIRAAKELKKSLMKHLFTYGPVPVEEAEKVRLKETEVGEIPRHWHLAGLAELAEIRYGLGQPPEADENGVPMIRATNIKRVIIVRDGLVRIRKDRIPASRNPFLKTGDIIVVRSGAYTGDVAVVTPEWEGSIAGYDLVVSPGERLVSSFCGQYLLDQAPQSYFKGQRTRSAQPHLNSHELGATLMPLPTVVEQHEIADILAAADTKVQALEVRKSSLEQLFRSLLRDLMTAKIRAH